MKKEKVINKYIGIGEGQGDEYEALPKEEIIEIIEKNIDKLYLLAWENRIEGYKNGYGCVCIRSGNIFGVGYNTGESEQAINNAYVSVFQVNMNEEDIRDDGETYEDAISYISLRDISDMALDYEYELDDLYSY